MRKGGFRVFVDAHDDAVRELSDLQAVHALLEGAANTYFRNFLQLPVKFAEAQAVKQAAKQPCGGKSPLRSCVTEPEPEPSARSRW